eukprot:6194132-Pleurochrysis_carterae.AAC.7
MPYAPAPPHTCAAPPHADFQPCRYIDRTMYIKTQPPDQRKKGFNSSDARRRDEFTLDIEVHHQTPLAHALPVTSMHYICLSRDGHVHKRPMARMIMV